MAKRNLKDGKPVGITHDKRGKPMLVLDNGMRRFIKQTDVAMWERKFGGAGAKPSSARKSTSVRQVTKREIDHKPRDLGWILRGFIEHARGVGRHSDPSDIFEPPDERDTRRDAHADQLELGREIHELLSAAVIHFGVTRDEWTRWYDAAIADNEYRSKDPLGDPLVQGRRVQASKAAWLPPVQGRVSSRFGAPRDGGSRTHEGIDVAVPTGTPIRAPEQMEIVEVGFGERAGRYVVGEIPRPDGSFFDDDRWRVTFAHLSEVQVAEGQRVRRGDVIGTSGATGQVTGPHLHLRTQWVEDVTGPIDDVYSVDPLALIPEQAFSLGQPVTAPGGPTEAIKQGDRVNVIIAPGAGRINVQGHGLPQADIDVQVPVGSVSSSSFTPAPAPSGHPLDFILAPGGAAGAGQQQNSLAGVAQTAQAALGLAGSVAQVTGPVLQAGGAVAQVGGAITSLVGFPEFGAPVAMAGKIAGVAGGAASAAGAVAHPLSELLGPPAAQPQTQPLPMSDGTTLV